MPIYQQVSSTSIQTTLYTSNIDVLFDLREHISYYIIFLLCKKLLFALGQRHISYNTKGRKSNFSEK